MTTAYTGPVTFKALIGHFAGPLSDVLNSEGISLDISNLTPKRFTELVNDAAEALRTMDWEPELVQAGLALFGAHSHLTAALAQAPQDQTGNLDQAAGLLEVAPHAAYLLR
ncbi:hypothetical protein ACEZDB_35825 [Streptacidiphilus sp. N1-3]|uniref:Uncharacterized protein n=1 Tax=Streptacidiphilus alkalitolerans TaxID=3342712 RepID=A0ABV6XCM2_9ACTN